MTDQGWGLACQDIIIPSKAESSDCLEHRAKGQRLGNSEAKEIIYQLTTLWVKDDGIRPSYIIKIK